MQYSYRKMPQHFHEPSGDGAPHWCIVMVPDEESQTITFMQGKDSWGLTEAQAKARTDELNNKIANDSGPAF
jgi:hypothetical protein